MTCYMRCIKCNEFYKQTDYHKCKKNSKVKLGVIRNVLQNVQGINRRVLVAENGLFAQSNLLFLVIKDNFELNHGLHSVAALEFNFIRIDEQISLWPEFPTVVPMDRIRIEWREELLQLELPSHSLAVFLHLLKLYEVERNITLNINDEFAEYQGEHFSIIIRDIS